MPKSARKTAPEISLDEENVRHLFQAHPGLEDKWTRAQEKYESFSDLVIYLCGKLQLPSKNIIIAPPKSPGSMVNKAKRKYDGDLNQVLDDNRATVELEKSCQIDRVLAFLRRAKDEGIIFREDLIVVTDLKNTFGDAAYNGFETVKANFHLDGVPTEIQFRYPVNERALSESHEYYKIERACELATQCFDEFEAVRTDRLTPQAQADLLRYLQRRGRNAASQRDAANARAFGKNSI